MKEQIVSEECAFVRDALMTECYDRVSRDAVDRHLAMHPACSEWATELGLLSVVLATGRGSFVPSVETTQELLDAYCRGGLEPNLRREVEEACCHDLKLAAALRRTREQRLQRWLQRVDFSEILRLLSEFTQDVGTAIAASLDEFSGLYRHKLAAVAAAGSQRSTFQTPDGKLVLSVVDQGAGQAEGPRSIELGIRAHDVQWVGQWALYKVCDQKSNLAAAGIVRLEPRGNTVRVAVPPTDSVPIRSTSRC